MFNCRRIQFVVSAVKTELVCTTGTKHRFAGSVGVRVFVEIFEQNLCGITSVFNPTNSLGGPGKEAKVTKASVVPAGFGFPLQLIFIKL
jgi:hypothetical protein